jgi:hypothetical protein
MGLFYPFGPTFRLKKDIYIGGMFNNYSMTPEYKMNYNVQKAFMKKAILVKQGFTNYKYTIADERGVIDHENAIDGNFIKLKMSTLH